MKGVIAIFVKTLGISPVKTRLAQTIGKEKAEEFYARSVVAVQAAIQEASRVKPLWVVAEEEGLESWDRFETIYAGGGELGEGLHSIYSKLLAQNDFVILIGADSPQITPEIISQAIDELKEHDFVFGPAEDGGFYLLCGKQEIPKRVWLNIPYSSDATLSSLVKELESLGSIGFVETLTDVDVEDDLEKLYQQLANCKIEEQIKLREWLRQLSTRQLPPPRTQNLAQ